MSDAPILFETLCLGCSGFVWFRQGRGWVHTDGHGRLWQRCNVCGWSGSEASMLADQMRKKSTGCPECGSFDLFTDHEAVPDYRSIDEAEDAPLTAEYVNEAKRVLHALMGES